MSYINDLIKGKLKCKEFYIIEEYGNKEQMAEVKPYYTNKYCTLGSVAVYNEKTNKISNKTIYKNNKGYYIKTNIGNILLEDFKKVGN